MLNLTRKATTALLVSLSVLCSGSEFAEAETSFYVALRGDDSNAGSEDSPFATIQRAQAAVRQLSASGLNDDVVVRIGAGTYFLNEPLQFGPADGGDMEHSVTYAAADGARVSISGGRIISDWKSGQDGRWTTTLPDVAAGDWFFRQLHVDDQRLSRGRYPEKGFLKIKSVSRDYTSLQFTEPLPEEDFGGQDAEVVVVQNWSISRERITKTTPTALNAETPIGWVGHSHCLPKSQMSAFIENSLSLVKKPGEWYLDRDSGVLYYKSAQGEDPNGRRFVAPAVDQLVIIEGTTDCPVRNLHFDGITFEHTNWLLPKIGYGGIQACYHGTTVDEATCYAVDVAIDLEYCDSCSIENCQIARMGGSGIGLGAGCKNNRVTGCLIHDVGGTGVNVGHMKVKDPLWADWENAADVPDNNEIANCYIHHVGEDQWGAHAIFDAMTRDTQIRHNLCAFIPYGAIATGYVWGTQRTSQQGCIIEYNQVHDVTLKLNDSGCLYTLGYQPGSVIRGNLLHGVRFGGFAGGQICNNGIFFDEGSKGFLLEDNVIYDVDQSPGARNTAVRFNRSSEEWQIWINNTIQIEPEIPEAAKELAESAGLQPEYKHLLDETN